MANIELAQMATATLVATKRLTRDPGLVRKIVSATLKLRRTNTQIAFNRITGAACWLPKMDLIASLSPTQRRTKARTHKFRVISRRPLLAFRAP